MCFEHCVVGAYRDADTALLLLLSCGLAAGRHWLLASCRSGGLDQAFLAVAGGGGGGKGGAPSWYQGRVQGQMQQMCCGGRSSSFCIVEVCDVATAGWSTATIMHVYMPLRSQCRGSIAAVVCWLLGASSSCA